MACCDFNQYQRASSLFPLLISAWLSFLYLSSIAPRIMSLVVVFCWSFARFLTVNDGLSQPSAPADDLGDGIGLVVDLTRDWFCCDDWGEPFMLVNPESPDIAASDGFSWASKLRLDAMSLKLSASGLWPSPDMPDRCERLVSGDIAAIDISDFDGSFCLLRSAP